MIIKRISILSGRQNEMDIPITPEQLFDWEHSNHLIQTEFPQLTADQREFILNGSTPEEWEYYKLDEC